MLHGASPDEAASTRGSIAIEPRRVVRISVEPKIFQSKSARKKSITIRLKNKNQSPIVPDQFFNRDPDRAQNFSIRVRLKIFHQTLLKFFSIRVWLQFVKYPCKSLPGSFSTAQQTRLVIFNQTLPNFFQSKSAVKKFNHDPVEK
ncbi:MAG TPA: hypothetical protein HA272_01945 [Methanoregula sp.]|nr:hypothetical protein [Methanoregula sp.]